MDRKSFAIVQRFTPLIGMLALCSKPLSLHVARPGPESPSSNNRIELGTIHISIKWNRVVCTCRCRFSTTRSAVVDEDGRCAGEHIVGVLPGSCCLRFRR